MGEDIAKHGGAYFGVTRTLFDEFGAERVRNTPISENTIVGAATGAALVGMRPVAGDHVRRLRRPSRDGPDRRPGGGKIRFMTGGQCSVPWVLRMPQGGGAGKSTAAQHGQSLEVWFAHIPGLTVVMPSTPYDVKGLLQGGHPRRQPRGVHRAQGLFPTKGPVPEEEYVLPLRRCDVKREGTSTSTVVASGYMVWHAMLAAQVLAPEGISVEVVDVRTIAPLEQETIGASARKTGRVLAVAGGLRTVRAGQRVGDGRHRAGVGSADGAGGPARRTPTPHPLRQQPRERRLAGHRGRRPGRPRPRPSRVGR